MFCYSHLLQIKFGVDIIVIFVSAIMASVRCPKSKSFVQIRMCSQEASLSNCYGGIESREMKSDFVKVIGIDLGRIFLFEFFVSSIVIVVFIEIHDSKKLFFVL